MLEQRQLYTWLVLPLAVVDASAVGVCYCLLNLVVALTKLPISYGQEQQLMIPFSGRVGKVTPGELVGRVGRTSYTNWTRNLKWYGFAFHSFS